MHTVSVVKMIGYAISMHIALSPDVPTPPHISQPTELQESIKPTPYDTYSTHYDSLDGGIVAEKFGINAMRRKSAQYGTECWKLVLARGCSCHSTTGTK